LCSAWACRTGSPYYRSAEEATVLYGATCIAALHVVQSGGDDQRAKGLPTRRPGWGTTLALCRTNEAGSQLGRRLLYGSWLGDRSGWNPEHPRGKHKARFFAALGFTAENADELRAALLIAAASGDAQRAASDQFGDRCVLEFEIEGPQGKRIVRST
jgi:uncharacterized protein DUF6883